MAYNWCHSRHREEKQIHYTQQMSKDNRTFISLLEPRLQKAVIYTVESVTSLIVQQLERISKYENSISLGRKFKLHFNNYLNFILVKPNTQPVTHRIIIHLIV
jgi:hypothetical protein